MKKKLIAIVFSLFALCLCFNTVKTAEATCAHYTTQTYRTLQTTYYSTHSFNYLNYVNGQNYVETGTCSVLHHVYRITVRCSICGDALSTRYEDVEIEHSMSCGNYLN